MAEVLAGLVFVALAVGVLYWAFRAERRAREQAKGGGGQAPEPTETPRDTVRRPDGPRGR